MKRSAFLEVYGEILFGDNEYTLKNKGTDKNIATAPLGIRAEDNNGEKYDLFYLMGTKVIVAYRHK